MAALRKLIEIGAKILYIFDDSYLLTIPAYTNSNSIWTSFELGNVADKVDNTSTQDIELFVVNNKESIFEGIAGYEIKREFAKALNVTNA